MAKKNIVTPVGTAIFCHLTQPNTKFGTPGFFQVLLRLTDAEFLPLKQEILTYVHDEMEILILKNGLKSKKIETVYPWHAAKDSEKNLVAGFVDMNIKTNAEGTNSKTGLKFSCQPELYAANNGDWNLETTIGFGSRVRVSMQPYAYFLKGALGISLRLKKVQVVTLVEYAGGSDFEPIEQPVTSADGSEPLVGGDFFNCLGEVKKELAAK